MADTWNAASVWSSDNSCPMKPVGSSIMFEGQISPAGSRDEYVCPCLHTADQKNLSILYNRGHIGWRGIHQVLSGWMDYNDWYVYWRDILDPGSDIENELEE